MHIATYSCFALKLFEEVFLFLFFAFHLAPEGTQIYILGTAGSWESLLTEKQFRGISTLEGRNQTFGMFSKEILLKPHCPMEPKGIFLLPRLLALHFICSNALSSCRVSPNSREQIYGLQEYPRGCSWDNSPAPCRGMRAGRMPRLYLPWGCKISAQPAWFWSAFCCSQQVQQREQEIFGCSAELQDTHKFQATWLLFIFTFLHFTCRGVQTPVLKPLN